MKKKNDGGMERFEQEFRRWGSRRGRLADLKIGSEALLKIFQSRRKGNTVETVQPHGQPEIEQEILFELLGDEKRQFF